MPYKICCIIAFLSVNFYSQYNKEAIELNNQAVQLYLDGRIEPVPEAYTEAAIKLLDKAISIDSSYYLAYYTKCNFLWELGKNQEALINAKLVLQIDEIYPNGFYLVGEAFEYLGELDSAKENYKKLIEYAKNYQLDTLLPGERQTLILLITVVEGKEKGLLELQKVQNHYRTELSQDDIKSIRSLKNNIEVYQGGGTFELMDMRDTEIENYCIETDKSIGEISDYLEENGINAGIIGRENGYYLQIQNKFKDKVEAIGLLRCE